MFCAMFHVISFNDWQKFIEKLLSGKIIISSWFYRMYMYTHLSELNIIFF